MAVGWVGRETSVVLRSLIPSHQQAATPTFASYVGRLRRTTKIVSRAKPRRPIRETARSLGTKLCGRIGVGLWAPRRWSKRAVGTQIDTATGLDFNQSLYDFIRDRM